MSLGFFIFLITEVNLNLGRRGQEMEGPVDLPAGMTYNN